MPALVPYFLFNFQPRLPIPGCRDIRIDRFEILVNTRFLTCPYYSISPVAEIKRTFSALFSNSFLRFSINSSGIEFGLKSIFLKEKEPDICPVPFLLLFNYALLNLNLLAAYASPNTNTENTAVSAIILLLSDSFVLCCHCLFICDISKSDYKYCECYCKCHVFSPFLFRCVLCCF